MSVPVTEDTPPDMLAGGMDLSVLLPDGRAGKLTVQRATPMMDLLVQLCTSYRLAPGSHVLQPLGENGPLPYKPSTPIGLLDAWSVRLLPRQRSAGYLQPQNALPFQHTFRLQIHLPKNQLLVQRVSPQTVLSSVLKLACDEKNLDGNKYELRHPGNLEERLQLDLTLADYGLSEVAVVSKIDGGADILALQREQDRRRRRVKAGHLPPTQPGCIKKKSSAFDGSVSSGRSSSPDSSGVTPPPQGTINVAPKVIPVNANITIGNQLVAPPKAPVRKRRPAPPPPPAKSESARQDETPAVTHSRTSSDSSGYHEASVLSDGPENNQVPLRSTEVHNNSTIPRRSKLPSSATTGINLRPQEKVNSSSLSRSMSNLTENGLNGNRVNGELSASTSSLSSGQGYRKKKAAPPPPPVTSKTSSLERKVGGSQISNHGVKNQTLPRAMSTSSINSRDSQRAPSIEEEESSQPILQHENVKTKVAVHNQDLVTPTMRANLVAELNNRLPNLRNDSVSSDGSNTGSSISSVVEESIRSKPEPIYAKVVRPSRQKNGADNEKVVSSDHVVNHTSSTKMQEPEKKTEIVKPPIPAPKARTIASTPVPLPRSLSSQTPKDIPEQISFDKDVKKSKVTHTRTSSETSSISSGIYGTVGRTFGSGLTLVAMSSDSTSISSFHSVSGVEEEDDSEPLEVKEATMFEPKLESQSEIECEDFDDEYYEEDSDVQDEFGRLGRWPASESLHDLGRDEEEDFADEGIENDDMAEEVARAFASATAELEAVILAEDLKAAKKQQEEGLEMPPPLPTTPVPTSPLVDGEEWTYELPAPPSAFRDKSFSPSHSPTSSRPTSPIVNVDPSSFGIVTNRKNPLFNEDEFSREIPMEKGNLEINHKMLPRQLAFEVVENESYTSERKLCNKSGVTSFNILDDGYRKTLSESKRNHGYKQVVNENLRNGDCVEFSAGLKSQPSDISNNYNNNQFKKLYSQENESKMYTVSNTTPEKKDDLQILKQSIKINEDIISGLKKSVEEEKNYNNTQQLSNFTITSYSREIDSNLIFEPEHESGQQTTVKVLRSNSFSNKQPTIPSVTKPATTTIRRSASSVYLALQGRRDSKEEEDDEKEKINVKVNDNKINDSQAAPLQSLQVLRTILPQLQHNLKENVRENWIASNVVQASQNNQDKVELFSKSVPEQVNQISRPYRPPAVNLSSWNERPKGLQVALKDDSDYRIGRGQASGAFEQSISSKETGSIHISQTTQPKITVPKSFNNNDVTSRNNAANQLFPSRNDMKANNQYKDEKLQGNEVSASLDLDNNLYYHENQGNKIYKQHQQPKYDTGALTMRIISHTTATGFRKKGVDTQPIKPAENSIIYLPHDGEAGEPRVLPVVRSVELKKSVSQSNVNEVQNGHIMNGSIPPVKESFQGVSSLAQKFGGNQMVERRAFKSSNTRRPVSEYFPPGRTEKVDNSVQNNSESLMRHSESLTNLNKAPRPGIMAPTVRGFRLPSEPKKPQQPIQVNPREQLMEAIRGFGGKNNLRCPEVLTQCES